MSTPAPHEPSAAPPDAGVPPDGGLAPASASPAADPLEACLARIEASDGFPSFSRQIQEVMRVLGEEDASVQHLARIVLKDYSLSLRVIRAANSFHYNRSGRPVLSATHAMVLLGVRVVRSIVSSLVLFEHFQQRSAGVRQLMLLSLLTANHSREAASHCGLPRVEEAYLCGMFRNLGEVLIASHHPEAYAEVLAEMRDRPGQVSERQACLRVLGFDYEALGTAMARRWNLPSEVIRTMGALDAPRDVLEQVVAFGHALTGVVYRREPEAARSGAALVLQKFGAMLGVTSEDLRDILDSAVVETRDTFRSMHLTLNDLRLRRQIDAAVGRRGQRPPDHPASPAPDRPSEALLGARLADEVERELRLPHRADLTGVLLMAIEAVLRGGGYDRVVFALMSETRKHVVGRMGLGTDVDALIERFAYPLGVTGGPVGTSLARRQELVLSDAWELRPDEADLLAALGARSCAVLPVLVRDVLVGCLYVDGQRTPEPPSTVAMAMTRRMRDAMARAMTGGEAGSQPA